MIWRKKEISEDEEDLAEKLKKNKGVNEKQSEALAQLS